MRTGQFGAYTIVAPLGAGGMGEVYRARDIRLGRDVALKILPAQFTGDPERRARFEREARILATLKHPHIGAIYGLERTDDETAIVLELVEGPTLAARLQHGPLKVPEALALARQIASALEAAHEKGIVHRDLKPANIVLEERTAASGQVFGEPAAKVLDFGLAKSVAGESGSDQLSTDTADATRAGSILGTPAYMSPEQARGVAVDKRTDIWAFGCVLFEMLSGRRAFDDRTATDIFVRILEREPDWSALPAETPPHVRTLLQWCLQKDPRKRLHDIADAAIQIDEGPIPGSVSTRTTPTVSAWWRRPQFAWIVAAAFGAGLLAMTVLYWRGARNAVGSSAADGPLEFTIEPPGKWSYSSALPAPMFAISPDGQQLAVVALSPDVPMLWVRPISSPSWRTLPGTEHAYGPFWSPDSESIAFFANGQIKTVRLTGGPAVTIGQLSDVEYNGGAWNQDGVILLGNIGPIRRIRATGGDLTPVTTVGTTDVAHRWPSFLPDGEHFLYVAQAVGTSQTELRIGSLSSTAFESLGPTASHAVYAAGHLFFVRSGRLVAQPFDAAARRATGEPLAVTEQTAVVPPYEHGQFTIATAGTTGVLAYGAVGRPLYQLTWRDRSGTFTGTESEPGIFFNLNLSPDEQRIGVSRYWDAPGRGWGVDVWAIDRARAGTSTRITFDPALDQDPVFSPDGTQLVFNSRRTQYYSLFKHAADGSGSDEPLVQADGANLFAPDFSPDGKFLMYGKGNDLWMLALPDRTPVPFLTAPFTEGSGVFSPDGHWIAYESDESGANNVYVRRFPAGPQQWRISRDGGRAVRWRGDGKELFFLAPDGTMMATAVDTTNGFRAGVPQTLFQTGLNEGLQHQHPYAILRTGQRFLMPVGLDPPARAPITVVWNWPAMIARLK